MTKKDRYQIRRYARKLAQDLRDGKVVNVCGRLVTVMDVPLQDENPVCRRCEREITKHEDDLNEGYCDDCARADIDEYNRDITADREYKESRI